MSQVNTLTPTPELAPEEEEFFALIVEHFDAAYYIEKYSDAAQFGVAPLEHWLSRGVKEGRQISRSIVLRYGKIAKRSTSRIWRHYRWRGEDIAVRLTKAILPDVMTQIFNQGRHDPAVLAAGVDAIAKLNQQDRENVHIDVVGLQLAIPHGIEFLLIVPNLSTSGEQRLAIDLVAALNDAGFRSIQTIVVTDQECSDSIEELAVPEPFQMNNVLFWQDFWIYGPEAVKLGQLAQLVRVLAPRVTIVANGRHGYELVARFGRALSGCTQIYCIYTEAAQSRDLGARFPRWTLPFATALTDDVTLAARLREQYGDVLGHGVEVLPRDSPAAFQEAVVALFGRP